MQRLLDLQARIYDMFSSEPNHQSDDWYKQGTKDNLENNNT